MADGATPGPSQYGSQRTHGTTPSVSSSQSTSSKSGRSKGSPAVETAVTRLLVSIKALLEALTLWSELKKSEAEVSDVYVQLGNDFNAAVAAFATYQIDMSELMAVPEDLRGVLEECLSEDATQNNLNKFLPTVRQIITGLLQGLRGKQSLYRQVISRHKSTGSSSSGGHERTESRSSRSERASQSSSARTSRASAGPDSPSEGAASRRSTASSHRSSRKTREPSENTQLPPVPQSPDDRFVGGFAPNLATEVRRAPSRPSDSPSLTPAATLPPPAPQGYTPARTPSPGAGRATPPPSTPLPSVPPTQAQDETTPQPLPRTASLQRADPSMKRYSLVDAPAVVVQSPSDDAFAASVPSPPPDSPAPEEASSLAALKRRDTLERRASKRFSVYTTTKLSTGPSVRGSPNLGAGGGGTQNKRRSVAMGNPTSAELAVLAEEPEHDEDSAQRGGADVARKPSRSKSPLPPVPPLPVASRSPSPAMIAPARANGLVAPTPSPPFTAGDPAPPVAAPTTPPAMDGPVTVFLQIGPEVKKGAVESSCTLTQLRMLFIEKFSYHSGQDNFPAIYIRDPASGIGYELEDMNEIKANSLLSLNIEPLDQVKQHIDSQMASLAKDIRDLKTTMTANKRLSVGPSFPIGEQSYVESTPPPPRPTDKQLATIARRISRFVTPEESFGAGNGAVPRMPMLPQMTGLSLAPQMTGASVMSEYTSRIVTDLKTQFDEVQNLRRDLGVMRQVYTDFAKGTKDALSTLRTQAQSVRKLATSHVGGARAYIDSGKATVDSRSQTALTRMEELQDLVENVKDDVLKRHVTPKPAAMSAIKADIDAVAVELTSLSDHVKTVKPMWKKTWEEELQNIVEEQQFLSHQEEFLADLLEDQKAVVELFGQVEKVVSIRNATPGRGRKVAYRPPPPPDDSGEVLDSVLMEIRTAAVDPERRLKAIAANQKNREKDLASRSDEFERELSGFVGGKKLRMTGGAEETERLRQKRNDTTLKAMFTGSSSTDGFSSLPNPESPAPSPTTATPADDT